MNAVGEIERIRVVLVGGGKGAATVISNFAVVPSVEICGVSDIRSTAPGIVMAKERGIPCFSDIGTMLAQDGISLVFDLTGVPAVFEQAKAALKPGQELVPAQATKLTFEMLELMMSRHKKVNQGILSGTNDMTRVVQELELIAGESSGKTKAISGDASGVATAAGQLSTLMTALASSALQGQTSMGSVAKSTEEMSTTVAEIARNAERARGVTRLAVESADGASKRVSELGMSAKQISKVTEAIAEIAEQTKLLALNATIEAARAGDAGRGFAVVASEVKELAKQTNAATADIRQKTDAIQEATAGTIAEIRTINKVIADVNEIVTIIASAVEQQSIATRDISRSASEVSSGIEAMSTNVNQVADVARSVASNISTVNANIEGLRELSDKVTKAAALVEAASERLAAIAGTT